MPTHEPQASQPGQPFRLLSPSTLALVLTVLVNITSELIHQASAYLMASVQWTHTLC